jgi:hypothetical protein
MKKLKPKELARRTRVAGKRAAYTKLRLVKKKQAVALKNELANPRLKKHQD